jgi:hypothetical protein
MAVVVINYMNECIPCHNSSLGDEGLILSMMRHGNLKEDEPQYVAIKSTNGISFSDKSCGGGNNTRFK